MAKNPSVTHLDATQVFKRCFNPEHDTIRAELSNNTQFNFKLDSSTDSIKSVHSSYDYKVSVDNKSDLIIIPEFKCIDLKSFNLYCKTNQEFIEPLSCRLEISPSLTDDVWFPTSLIIYPSIKKDELIIESPVSNIIAHRARVKMSSNLKDGSFDLYLVAHGV